MFKGLDESISEAEEDVRHVRHCAGKASVFWAAAAVHGRCSRQVVLFTGVSGNKEERAV